MKTSASNTPSTRKRVRFAEPEVSDRRSKVARSLDFSTVPSPFVHRPMAFKKTLAGINNRNQMRNYKRIGDYTQYANSARLVRGMQKLSLNKTNLSGLVNKVIQNQAQHKVYQNHFTQLCNHNTGYILAKNIFASILPGTTSTTREGEHVFMDSVDFRLSYTPAPDRGLQQIRVIAYLTTNGTAAVDTVPFTPSSNTLGNLMIQTINEDFCKVIFDRIVTLTDPQSGKLVSGSNTYSSKTADIIEEITGWAIGATAQVPAKLLQFKIPVNRKLTYASNTLLLGNNVLNFVFMPYEAYGSSTEDHIGFIQGSMSVNFKDAP